MTSYRHLIIALLAIAVLTGLALLALQTRDQYQRLDPDYRKVQSIP
jgi:hypothetical protein